MPSIRLAALALPMLLFAPLSAARAAPEPAGARARALEAEALQAHALQMLERRTIEARRTAISDLERATLLLPEEPGPQLLLARTYLAAGFRRQAMRRFERVVSLAPLEPEARFGLAQVWRRDWLKYLEPRSLERATEHASIAARLDPTHVDAWLMLSSLLVERGQLRAALAAAQRALEVDSLRSEARVAVASARWRLGEVDEADRMFRAGIPGLRRSVRERYEDIAPLVSEVDTMTFNRLDDVGRTEYARRFWRDHDPDLATEVNEAQLEYWARVTQAYFLFFDPRRREWDERG